MTDTPIKMFFLAAIMLNGILCGSSLDLSIKQLPARHSIGMKAYSEYAKAADLGNGIIWYIIISFCAAFTSIGTAILVWIFNNTENFAIPIFAGGLCAICYIICTIDAIPFIYKQKQLHSEEKLKKLFLRFEKVQTIRSILIVLNLLTYMWALLLVMMT